MSNDNRTFTQKLTDEIIPSAISGGIGILGASMIMGVDLSITLPILSYNLPAWASIGIVIAGADVIAYMSHDMIIEKIPQLQAWSTVENKLLAPVLSGIGTYALLAGGVQPGVSIMNSVLLGAGSSVAGRYLYDSPMLNMNKK